jgi:HD-GYP domain-containing protein (c-di-GMP phosphodiesterase class II)
METSRLSALTGPAAQVVQQRSPLLFNAESDWAAQGIGDSPSFSGTNAKVLCVPIEAGDRVLGAIEVVRRDGNQPFTQSELDTARVIGAMAGITIENAQLRQSMEEGYRSTIRALASAIDAKDPYTCGHSQSVAQYSLITGMILNLPTDSIRMLETGALLHDIGKIGIDDAILRKPRRLTAAEHAIIRDHPVIGAAIVHDIGL